MISKKIFGNGFKINLDGKDPFLYIDNLKKSFLNYGIILIDNFNLSPEKLEEFTGKFTLEYSSDAARRKINFKKKNLRSVDLGLQEIPLHSEASFAVTRPKIIWFYSLPDNLSSSPTTICDGIKIWDAFPNKLKEKFLSLPIIYDVSVDIPKKESRNRKWFIDKIGSQNCFVDYENGKFNYNFSTFAVNYDQTINRNCFCNHLLSVDYENQILKAKFVNGDVVDKNLLKEINKYAEPYIYEHKWSSNQMIMLDNFRFMHGRRKISDNKKRNLINIQSLRINF